MKAIVLGAVVDAAGAAVVQILTRALSIGEPETGALKSTIYAVAGASIYATVMAVVAYLTGGVLSRRLPDLPMRRWIAINALLGFLFGLITHTLTVVPVEYVRWTFGWIVALTIWFVGLGAFQGAVQASVLRKAAQRSRAWIVCSALTGLCWFMAIPADLFAPERGTDRDLTFLAAGVVDAIVTGLILLPAVVLMRPRGEHPIPMLFE
jgi:hypothetical protein